MLLKSVDLIFLLNYPSRLCGLSAANTNVDKNISKLREKIAEKKNLDNNLLLGGMIDIIDNSGDGNS
jgi:hypothetical protein